MDGWMWLLILAVSLLACVYSLYVISKNFWRINDPKDIINVLSKWWRHCKGQNLQQSEFTLYFSSIDDKEKLKKGSAKKYLREIVSKDELWSVVREGSKTLTVKRKGYTLRVGSDPLSM